jgi:hypothetical protein
MTMKRTIFWDVGGGGKVARVRRYFYTGPLVYAKLATLFGRRNTTLAGCSNGRPLKEEDLLGCDAV